MRLQNYDVTVADAQTETLRSARSALHEGGLLSDLLISIFLLPTLYVWMAGSTDVLPEPEAEFDEAV